MGKILASDIITLNNNIKALFNERKNPIEGGINVTTGNGYKTAPTDFSTTPAAGGKILADAYIKTFGALNKATMTFDSTLTATTMTTGTKIPTQAQYTNALNWSTNKRIAQLCSSGTAYSITKANTGCDAFCTGLCSGTCYGQGTGMQSCGSTCASLCYNGCQGCGGNCTSLCYGGCSGTAASNDSQCGCGNSCSSRCSMGCTGCSEVCTELCGSNCTSNCYSSCQAGCTNATKTS